MRRILIDTNALLRIWQPTHPQCGLAEIALDRLRRRKYRLCVVPQVLYEFWAVSTRPVPVNGLGLEPTNVRRHIEGIRQWCLLLDGKPGVYDHWERLVASMDVRGKATHDARIIAAMQVHRVDEIVTFNVADFRRYPGITVFSPDSFLS